MPSRWGYRVSVGDFPDHFSGHAADYARYRPRYPAALFDFVASLANRHQVAWDCATGNGQAALALADHFTSVIATDASEEQLRHAASHRRIDYRHAAVERSGLDAASVDLVTAATAVHWFDLETYYAEVRRVSRPGAVIALWTYLPHLEVTPVIDRLIDTLALETLASHWAPQVFRYAREGYTALPFPFQELSAPDFGCTATWEADDLCQYLRTWSAVRAYRRATLRDPIADLTPEIHAHWGDPAKAREVKFPLHLRVGRIAPTNP